MGLLDDAIREHLELKRQRGADPAELTRAEQEALGPAVRQAADAAPAEAPAENGGAGLAHATEGAASGAAPAPAPEAAPETEPAASHVEQLEPAVPDPEAPEPAADPQATVSFDAEDIFAEEDAPTAPDDAADEDVLEETPDFLQETPEHDRLWFEQKPPRDFDFDG